uniref:Transposase n=1 Tax=Leptobrachium leishanense TaxID=445787 RepID=A0A8C5WFT6_9ANUR
MKRILECQLKTYRNLWHMTPRRKPLLSKKNIAAHLKFFAEDHLDVPQHYWQNILWTDETKIELFGKNTQHYVWRKKGTAHQHHPHCKTWRREHHGLGLLCCLRAWTDCCH